ncbi:MAG TPA: PKD domain-containing protein, partial [Gaiellales bacterium]|nr:PKD domain-containing protein [Gaiellales bacterium]
INPSGTQVDVVDQDSTVVPITVATNTAGAPIQVASGVFGLAWGPAGKTVWVTDLNAVPGQVGGSLIPVDGATVKPGIPAGSAPDSVAITPDQPPVARFSVEPARHGSLTNFDASASAPQSTPIAKYAWKFGDGTSATTSVPTTSHTYARSGTYTVTLTLTDAAGTSTTQVFTGQTMLRNGSRLARAARTLVIH